MREEVPCCLLAPLFGDPIGQVGPPPPHAYQVTSYPQTFAAIAYMYIIDRVADVVLWVLGRKTARSWEKEYDLSTLLFVVRWKSPNFEHTGSCTPTSYVQSVHAKNLFQGGDGWSWTDVHLHILPAEVIHNMAHGKCVSFQLQAGELASQAVPVSLPVSLLCLQTTVVPTNEHFAPHIFFFISVSPYVCINAAW